MSITDIENHTALENFYVKNSVYDMKHIWPITRMDSALEAQSWKDTLATHFQLYEQLLSIVQFKNQYSEKLMC